MPDPAIRKNPLSDSPERIRGSPRGSISVWRDPPCPVGHADLESLNRSFAARVTASEAAANPTTSSISPSSGRGAPLLPQRENPSRGRPGAITPGFVSFPSSAPARAEPHRTRDASRGAAGSVATGSRSVLLHAPPGSTHVAGGQAREADSVIGEETSGPQGAESAPAPTVRAFCCGQEVFSGLIRRGEPQSSGHGLFGNPEGHSFCRICGHRGPFTIRILAPGQSRLQGV